MCETRVENRRSGLCEIATTMILSAGIGGEILQKRETWLQCRQQVARDLSRGASKFEVSRSEFCDICDEVEST